MIIDDFYINYKISFASSKYLATGDPITTIAYNFQTHVSSGLTGSLFYNYKSYFSFVLLGVASADYRFVMVNVRAYGSGNDSGVLNHTTFFKQL